MSDTTLPATEPEAPGPAGEGATDERLRYRLLTGPDDHAFCARVSAALDEGYELHGSPAATYNGDRVIVAQAVVLPSRPASRVELV